MQASHDRDEIKGKEREAPQLRLTLTRLEMSIMPNAKQRPQENINYNLHLENQGTFLGGHEMEQDVFHSGELQEAV